MSVAHPTRHVLSKSSFVRGCQCHKSLYLYKHFYKTRDPLSPAQRAIFARGTNVGVLARELFPGGSDASPPTPFQYAKSVQLTRELLEAGVPAIYEAAFITGGVLAAMDILVPEADSGGRGESAAAGTPRGRETGRRPVVRAYEVKSSTAISDTYLLDAALQYWVITGAGVEVRDISIVHIDGDYQRRGELEIERLFRVESVLEEVLERQDFVAKKVEELIGVVGEPGVPEVQIGPHCTDPYPCDFTGTCWRGVPEYSVFDIARLSEEKKFELYHRGILDVAEVPDDFPLSGHQRLQVEVERSGAARIDRAELARFLSAVAYPRYYVDFESFQPAVPRYDRSHPYQQIPFQFSLHIVESPGDEPRHVEYLAEAGPDPRAEFIETLLDSLGERGPVIVYNRSFEDGRLADLARDFPRFGERIEGVRSRMVDLMVPFRDRLYCTAEMRGSYSIKAVLPALVPELSYGSLRIQDGTAASIAFEGLIETTDERRRARVRRQLLEYCELDSLAMVRIHDALDEVVRRGEASG